MALFNLTPASVLSQVSSAIDLFTNSARADTVAIFDQETLRQVFEKARPIKVDIRETSKVMDYPVETGVTLSDHHIINPTLIEVMFFISSENYSEAYDPIRNAYLRATKLTIQTRTGVYSNMIISDVSHDQDPDMFDASMVSVRFKEIKEIIPSSFNQQSNYKPADPTMGNTITRGAQIASSITKQIGALLSYAKLGQIFGKRF